MINTMYLTRTDATTGNIETVDFRAKISEVRVIEKLVLPFSGSIPQESERTLDIAQFCAYITEKIRDGYELRTIL